MPSRARQHERTEITFDGACDVLESALSDGTRAAILDAVGANGDFGDACKALRGALRTHTFPTAAQPIALQRIVQSFDGRARRTGLHVLESWDYQAHRFAPEITPVLMLDQCALSDVAAEHRRNALAVLLDHYFAAVLGLVTTRALIGDANANLDRVDRLLAALQGAHGSGRHFADDAETLLLIAVSHYHPEEAAYDELLATTDALNDAHRHRLATAATAALGGHLRWGLRFMYRRDVGKMRADNVVDYPWLVFGLVTLMREYLRAGDLVTLETLLNGLTADPWFVVGKTPIGNGRDADHAELRQLVLDNRAKLVDDFLVHRPTTTAFTPLGFSCNFLCNTVTAMVATSLSPTGARPSINSLFTRREQSEAEARTLMSYAVANAQTAGGAALIVYDPYDAAHVYNATMAVLKNS